MNPDDQLQSPRRGWQPLLAVAVTTLAAIAISVYCLSLGWAIIFQNLFYVPIIIGCVYYGKKGFAFSVGLSFTYLLLIVTMTKDPTVTLQAWVRVALFVGIAAVVTFLAMRKRADQAEALNTRLTHALLQLNHMTEATLQEITDYALEESVRLTQSTIGYLAFLNDDESVLTMHSWSKSAMAECAIVDKPIVYPVASTGLWGEAVRQRRAVITNDYAAANPLKKGCPHGHVAVTRHMNAPVFVGSRIVLVAGVGNKAGEYDQGDVQQLTLLMEGMWRLIERKRAEEALKAETANLDAIFESSPVGMMILDATTNIVRANAAIVALSGGSRSDMVQHRPGNALRCIHSTKDPRGCGYAPACPLCPARKGMEGLLANGGTISGAEVPLQLVRNGEPQEVWLRIGAEPIQMNGCRHLCVAMEDVTPRKRAEENIRTLNAELEQRVLDRTAQLADVNQQLLAENAARNMALEALRESENKHRTLYESSRDAIMTLFPPDWKFTAGNPATIEMFGAKDEAGLTALGPWDVSPECQPDGDLSAVKAKHMIETAMEKGSHFFEWTHRKIDGPNFPAAVLLTRVELGGKTGLQATVRDISKQKQAEAAVLARNEELKGFAYTVSHDLKAPLRGIAGYSDELDRKHRAGLGERAQFCISQILTATRNLDHLIEDLLHYSRLDAETPSLTPVNLRGLVEAILRDRALVIAKQGADVTVDIPDFTLEAWERGLSQVLSNLIDNALKYSRKAQPPRLTVVAQQRNGTCHVTVTDNGIGFDMKYHDRIFGLFNRLVRADEFEGTGAGLAIVKKLMEKLGGTIRAESAPGQGATFFVELPREPTRRTTP